MNIIRYINGVKTESKDFSEFYIDNETVSKILFIVNERIKSNENISHIDLIEKSG